MRHFLSCKKHSADSTHHGDPVLFSMGVGSTCVYPIQLLHSLLQPLIVNPFSPYFGIAGRKNTIQRWPIEHVQDCLAQHCSGLEEPHPFLLHLSPSLLESLDTTESVSNNDKESDRANKKQMAMAMKVSPVRATRASTGLETRMERTTKEGLRRRGIRRSGNDIHSESESHMPETSTEHATALLPLIGGLGRVWTSTEAPPSFHSLLYPREGTLKPIRQSPILQVALQSICTITPCSRTPLVPPAFRFGYIFYSQER